MAGHSHVEVNTAFTTVVGFLCAWAVRAGRRAAEQRDAHEIVAGDGEGVHAARDNAWPLIPLDDIPLYPCLVPVRDVDTYSVIALKDVVDDCTATAAFETSEEVKVECNTTVPLMLLAAVVKKKPMTFSSARQRCTKLHQP